MADDLPLYTPGALPEGAIPSGPDAGDAGPALQPGAIEPPAAGPAPSLLNQAWRSVASIPPMVWNDLTTAQPAAPKEPPTGSPFFNALAHGMRETVDQGAGWLARGAEGIFGKNTVAKLPGYRSADDIEADIKRRAAEFAANPHNEAGSPEAAVGSAVGSGLVLGGPLMKAGALIKSGLEGVGAAALPGVARALEYLGGSARAAPDATLPARLATRGASLAAQGAEAGGATAALQADPDKPFLPQVVQGAGEGAIAAPAVGGAVTAATYPVRAALGQLPGMVAPNLLPLAERFEKQYGIRLDPSQLTQNPFYKLVADQGAKLPFSGAGNRIAQSRLEWQGAVAREFGEATTEGITHEVANRAARRIGAGMDAIAARTTIQRDPDFLNEMAKIVTDMRRIGVTESQLPPLRAALQDVMQTFEKGGGKIAGEGYQNLTNIGGPLHTHIQSTDPTIAGFTQRIRSALDGAFERSAAPGDRAALQELRGQYRALKTVQPLVEQKGHTGDIDPNRLLERVIAQSHAFDPSTKGLAYSGGGPLGDLAYGGQVFFGRPPDSGTAARNIVTAGLLGGGVYFAPGAAAGTAAGLAANRAIQTAIRSPAVGGSMIENSLRPRGGPRVERAIPFALPGLLTSSPP